MVFYFKARPEAGDYTIFMGLDKHENEELIKYGFPEDIWYSFFFFYFCLQFLAISIQICNLFPSGSLIYWFFWFILVGCNLISFFFRDQDSIWVLILLLYLYKEVVWWFLY